MTDQEIAAGLVKAEILRWFDTVDGHDGSLVVFPSEGVLSTRAALTDWRVAGACLERMSDDALCGRISYKDGDDDVISWGWLRDPRAICEAFAVSAGRES